MFVALAVFHWLPRPVAVSGLLGVPGHSYVVPRQCLRWFSNCYFSLYFYYLNYYVYCICDIYTHTNHYIYSYTYKNLYEIYEYVERHIYIYISRRKHFETKKHTIDSALVTIVSSWFVVPIFNILVLKNGWFYWGTSLSRAASEEQWSSVLNRIARS